jgi:hypothetical protein
VLYGLLLVVAAAAAVLSFAALRDLALLCGFAPGLAWLLPVVVDAGAAAGSLVWLGGAVPESARRFARFLALTLLGLSVAANALGHGLAAFRQEPAWWVVVIVSAIAPAVLGAVVHLAVLVGREPFTAAEATAEPDVDDDRAAELIAAGAGRRRISRELGVSEYEARRLIDRARTTTPPPDLAHAATNGAPIRSEILL